MIKFGGDLDDPGVDPFGLKGEVENALFEQAAEAIQNMNGCGVIYSDDRGERHICLRDKDKCVAHHPELVQQAQHREAKFFDRYVGTLVRWWRR